jgi:ankyrin repeat protein
VNLTDLDGMTPLSLAVKGGNKMVVELLLAHVDLDVKFKRPRQHDSTVMCSYKWTSDLLLMQDDVKVEVCSNRSGGNGSRDDGSSNRGSGNGSGSGNVNVNGNGNGAPNGGNGCSDGDGRNLKRTCMNHNGVEVKGETHDDPDDWHMQINAWKAEAVEGAK